MTMLVMVMTTIMMTDGEDDDDEDYDDDVDDDDDDGDDADDNDNDDGDMLLFLQLLRADPKSKSPIEPRLGPAEKHGKNAMYKIMAINWPPFGWLIAVPCQNTADGRASAPASVEMGTATAGAFVKGSVSAVRGLKCTAPLVLRRAGSELAYGPGESAGDSSKISAEPPPCCNTNNSPFLISIANSS